MSVLRVFFPNLLSYRMRKIRKRNQCWANILSVEVHISVIFNDVHDYLPFFVSDRLREYDYRLIKNVADIIGVRNEGDQ